MGWTRAFALAWASAHVLALVRADLAETYPMTTALNWEVESEMQMSISAADGDVVPLLYTVIPLTTDLGLNESQTDRGQITIEGKLTLADASTYPDISGDDVIPYLSCDQMNNSFIQPNEILNHLMSNSPQPAAILLYSQKGQCCGLAGQNLNYHKILTMPNIKAASQIENITTSGAGTARASISGNFTEMDQQQDQSPNGNNSAVAMSILYSITGLITLLFLVIIATGAIRAHRYPERYGPRAGFGGRSRQSRAKGLARAVLETLPIVKFGEPQPTKPDLDTELENAPGHPPHTTDANREAPHNHSERHLSTIPESPTQPAPKIEVTGALRTSNDASTTSAGEGNSSAVGANNSNDEALGCSICTEDFTVGEDVRVLPCNHKFHPQCVDPWLVNVSGTCPLCRLDLRPEQGEDEEAAEGDGHAPPLGTEGNEAGDSSSSSRRRSRFFDIARLRHAPVEERIEVLRRFRTEQRQGPSVGNEDEGHGRARLSDRLRDRFHIRTRAAQ